MLPIPLAAGEGAPKAVKVPMKEGAAGALKSANPLPMPAGIDGGAALISRPPSRSMSDGGGAGARVGGGVGAGASKEAPKSATNATGCEDCCWTQAGALICGCGMLCGAVTGDGAGAAGAAAGVSEYQRLSVYLSE
eukprot:scaffold171494_cov39-Tisochrysis_lutea.AAC.1